MQENTQFDEQKIKKYLFGELSDEERDAMEDEFFENDELFVEIAETENLLVDLYARKKLAGDELIRFEKSLEKIPERRAKIANAAALQTFIDEERTVEETETAVIPVPSVWQKIGDLFKIPVFGYSMAAMLLLFAIVFVFLVVDNRRKADEIANLQNQTQDGWEQKQKELQEKFDMINSRFEDLQKQSEAQENAGDLAVSELENLREEKERVQRELERLRQEKNITPTPSPKPQTQQIFAFLLTPTVGTRGGSGSASRNLSVSNEAKQITLRLVLPENFDKDARISISLNGKTLASNLPAQKNMQIKVAPADIAEGLNRISITGADGKEISKYIFTMQKK